MYRTQNEFKSVTLVPSPSNLSDNTLGTSGVYTPKASIIHII